MSDISITDNDSTLQSLREQLAALQATVSSLQQSQSHPLQVDAPRARLLVLPKELIEAVPSIAGQNFFTAPEAEDEDPVFLEDVVFPKNQEQQYHAPNLDLPWPDKAKSHQSFDKSLAKIQERLAFTTRPVDEFATEIFATVSDPTLRDSILDFVQVLRSQLAITARQITKMRKDNFVVAKGLKPTPDKGKGVAITQEDLTAQIKAAKEYEKACAPAKDSSQGDSRGRGRFRNGFRNGYFNRQFQQPQPYQQYGQHQQAHSSPIQQAPAAYANAYDDQSGHSSGGYFQRGHRGRGRGRAQKQQTPPTTSANQTAPRVSKEEEQAIEREILALLAKRAIEHASGPGFRSRLFTIPKKTGDLRPVLNLKPLNRFVEPESFKMET
ncbi:hypothetical protein EC968_009647, partial [Mortierella alpina]